ncbi:MAG: hypothetical protein RJB66_2657 [Pseudomonadota bacterium]|jgi:hypothetical protein
MIRYFNSSIWVTVIGLALAAFVGWEYQHSTQGALEALFLAFVLSILEVSISFDNAVVNATVLKKMTPLWQHRFITWGMLIAVFGMRLVFPLIVVSVATSISPWEALKLAALSPDEYSKTMLTAHVPVSAFGGAFLMMVALKYFFDTSKEVHWIRLIERPLSKLGKMESIEIALVTLGLALMARWIPEHEKMSFLLAGLFGVITYIGVDGIGAFLSLSEDAEQNVHRASAMMFLYLEVLDASFSFDGVIGSFAISNNLFIIAIGLGIGAMFVRSLTILFVEKDTLTEFRYLEHGAFYAILALAVIMFLNTVVPIPEVVTGIIGAAFIGLSLYSSLQERTSTT